MHFDSCVVNCVLFAVGRNYSANLVGRTIAGQISAVHHDTGVVVRLDNGLCAEHSFSVNAQFNIEVLKLISPIYLLVRSPSTHNMSPICRRLFLHFMPKLMMMRRTQYTLPDYDDTAPCNGYTNEIDVR